MEGLMSAFADGEWDSCDNIFLNEDADFMLDQLFSNEVQEGFSSSTVAPAIWSLLENDSNLTEASQSFLHPDINTNHLSTHYGFDGHREVGVFPEQLSNSNALSEYYMTGDIASPTPFFWNAAPEDGIFIAGLEMSRVEADILTSIPNTPLSLKRKLDVTMYGQHNSMTSEIPNKKTRMIKNDCGNKTKTLPKKNWKSSRNICDLEAVNPCKQMTHSLSFSSEDDSNSNASQELTAVTSPETNLLTSHDKNGKNKGRRGRAIDPQSLYARKRRERINERLRILQNLIPNGTKVDISTMLEEAVSYVKFLQTQIKLLSSDDLWMYAPIAYNGIDVGLNRRLSQNL